jgi:4-amino-4-deoxy-L-arabinose transferase-like glycosyltransferase
MNEKSIGKLENLKKAVLATNFIRGAILTLVPCGVLAWLMTGTAAVGDPNISRKLGHVTYGLWVGLGLLLVATAGILDMMGAWSWRKEKDRCRYEPPSPFAEMREPWYARWMWLFVLVIAAGLIMARIGSFGAWDPWEGHYGEVGRRILEQDDWISLFWYNDWFFSKPVLDMWLMALGMGFLGINFWPDGNSPILDWGARGPIGIIAVIGILAVYHTAKRRWGWQAGFFAAIVLTTMPFYFFLSHQTMTDMPFVAPLTVSLCLLMLGMYEDPEKKARIFKLRIAGREIPLSGFHLLMLMFVLTSLSQYLYYATRGMQFTWGTMGQENVRMETQVIRFPVWALGPIFGIPWAIVMFTLRNERRTQVLYLMGGYLAAAMALLGKGLGAVFLPGGIVLLHLIITGDWKKLKEVRLLRGAVIVLAVGFPWFVAMHLRHGNAFLDRLLVHDHINRLAVGVHGDVGTFGYYTQELVVGTFPWIGLIPAALLYRFWSRRKEGEDPQEDRSFVFLISWFICAFLLFSMMITKFHHYVFPAVPPLALAIGIFMKDLLRGKVKYVAPTLIGAFCLLVFAARDVSFKPNVGTRGYERLIHLFIYNYSRAWPSGEKFDYALTMTIISIIAASFILLMIFPKIRKLAAVGLVVIACWFAGWAMNVFMVDISPHWSQAYIIRQYYKDRTSTSQRLVVFKLNWKGENFYTGGRAIIDETMDDGKFKAWLTAHRGERHYFLVSMGMKGRVESYLNETLGPGHKAVDIVPPEIQSNKFTVVVSDL